MTSEWMFFIPVGVLWETQVVERIRECLPLEYGVCSLAVRHPICPPQKRLSSMGRQRVEMRL
jgi:hypothetical protein